MAFSKNRFALLEDKANQPGHGAEDTLESPASISSKMKRKKKKNQKVKQPRQIPDDKENIPPTTSLNFVYLISTIWSLLNYFFGFAFLLSGTAMKLTPSTDRSTTSKHTLSANDSSPSQTPTTNPPSPTTPKMPLSRPELQPRKPSSESPPAYTPQTEFLVPVEEQTGGMCVNAHGSPRGAGIEYVEVGVDIRWPDRSTTYTVRRGISQEDLKRITPVKGLLHFGAADIKVSPPASAKSGTKIHVDSSYEGLRDRVKEDLEEALERKLEKSLKARTKDYCEFAAYMWMRHLQDSVYYAMSSDMGREDFKGYESRFTIEILLPSDIEHLKSATDREKANTHAHPGMRDQKAQELRWRCLDTLLSEDNQMDEKRARYRRYFEFIKMKLF